MRNAGLDEAEAGIKIARRNISKLRYVDNTILTAESEELKSLLMKVKQESEKVGLKLNIKKTKIIASGLITSWEINGETVETVRDFILGGFKITADGDYSHEIKRRLLLGRKVMTNLDSILKNRDITLPTKVHLVKAMVFPVVMYGCEIWTIKKVAAAAAKSLQSCPTLCDPIDGSPRGSPIPGIFQARTGVGCHFLLQCMKVKSETEFTQSCLTLRDPMDCSPPGSSTHGIFQARVLEWGAIAFSDQGLLTNEN